MWDKGTVLVSEFSGHQNRPLVPSLSLSETLMVQMSIK